MQQILDHIDLYRSILTTENFRYGPNMGIIICPCVFYTGPMWAHYAQFAKVKTHIGPCGHADWVVNTNVGQLYDKFCLNLR